MDDDDDDDDKGGDLELVVEQSVSVFGGSEMLELGRRRILGRAFLSLLLGLVIITRINLEKNCTGVCCLKS